MSRSVPVTGGNRGIGLAIAKAFTARGDRVAVTYRSGEPPAELLGVRCDVTRTEEVERAFEEVEAAHGPVEVLVANAGITRDGLLMRMPEEDFDAVLDTNLKGAFRVAKRASRGMMRARRGRIVLISSAVALAGEAGQTNYAASKAGLVGFGRSLAKELAPRNVTVNIVAPGLTSTDMTAALPEERIRQIVDQVPLGRAAEPQEIAHAVTFLASPEASYITGAVIPVDGGASMGH
ncbi:MULTISPECIES: 3-oxoacyl-ACP reductase FabG [unclassified Streptomyces]|uniref:3-oxoacyl-ACP reductase FabG n=1 Tax=unclassified Streptomyces TaxID=2593676 RepID=UPI000F749BB8|nr:3-oxoacyl-ACP reductase FabG [Streptomyces sp. WAC00469]RSR99043.1 SDR family oxidoreductase [Streptomyces sp. WAC00469]